MGSGAAFFDADGDGWQDVAADQFQELAGPAGGGPSRHALYRNNRDGTFADVTARSGLGVSMYGLGVAAADYDNDGRQDVYITGLDGNRLFRGIGGGTIRRRHRRARASARPGFRRAPCGSTTTATGVWTCSSCRYVEWSIENGSVLHARRQEKSYCTPESYKGQSPVLFRNTGNGTFEDVTRAAGLYDPASKALGAALIDHDERRARWICSSPTTRSRTACIAIAATARSRTSP